MAKADAWSAPGSSAFVRRKGSSTLAGNARVIAEPAYRRLLAAEPILRRSIPALIVVFLLVIAGVRFLSMMTWYDDVERNAKAILNLSASELSGSVSLMVRDGEPLADHSKELLEWTLRQGAMGSRHILAITDGAFRVLAVSPESTPGKARRSTASSTAGSRCSCSATAPA